MTDSNRLMIVELTSKIISAFVSNNSVPPTSIPTLMSDVHASLQTLTNGGEEKESPLEPLTPPVSIRKSVTNDYLICLEDGKKFKSLKRHLATLGMTPEQYRAKWGLPASYPMVAPGYSSARSNLAKTMGLGNARKKAVENTPEPAQTAKPETKKGVGRPKKKAA